MDSLNKVKEKLTNLPEKKSYLDFILAFLSIPVVLTAIITNINNLKAKDSNNKIVPTPTVIMSKETADNKVLGNVTSLYKENLTSSPTPTLQTTATPTPENMVCKKQIGPISISYPEDNLTIKDNPVCFIIKYNDDSYCAVVWSYRINNGNWSEYSSNSPCIYNPPPGNITFDLRVQSTVSEDKAILQRIFIFQPIPSPTINISTQSAIINY